MAKLDTRDDSELQSAKAHMREVVVELMHKMRGGGIPNPMLAAEQLAYLLLLKHMGGEPWSQLEKSDGEKRFEVLRDELFPQVLRKFPLGNQAQTRAVTMRDATFAFPSAQLLDLVVRQLVGLRHYQWQCADLLDTALDEVSATSNVGSPRTPARVSDSMIALTKPRADELVLDPAAGACERLLAVIQHSVRLGRGGIEEGVAIPQARVRGVDLDATMVRLGAMSLSFHGVHDPDVSVNNVLTNPPDASEQFDVILCQPPFGNRIDPAMLAPEFGGLSTLRSELLFAELVLKRLGEHGRAAIVLPVNTTFTKTAGVVRLRERLLERLRAVITLPQGTFQPHTNVETVLLVVGDRASRVVFIDARDDERGQSPQSAEILQLSAKIVDALVDRGILPEKSIPEELLDRITVVDREQIEKGDYSLQSSTYRSTREAADRLENPLVLFREIEQVESEIAQHLAELGRHLVERASPDD